MSNGRYNGHFVEFQKEIEKNVDAALFTSSSLAGRAVE
jgi:hypothetical protein